MNNELAWILLEGATLLALLAVAVLWWRSHERSARLAVELQASTETLRHAEKLGRIGTWWIDLSAGTLHWSDRVFEIHARRLADGEPDLDTAIDYYAAQDREMVEALVARAIENGTPFEFTASLLAEDGSTRTVLSRGMCSADAQGRVMRVFGVFIETAHVIQLAEFVNDNIRQETPGRPDRSL